MGDKRVWLEGASTEDFFLYTNQTPVWSQNSCTALILLTGKLRALAVQTSK
jgi:hypothetical protein